MWQDNCRLAAEIVMKIVTHYDPKPIPIRTADWSAYDEETYDCDCDEMGYISRSPVGYGATAIDAIADLMEQMDNG